MARLTKTGFTALPLAKVSGLRLIEVERKAGDARPFIKDTAVAHDNEMGRRPHIVRSQQPCRQLRADAGGIAHGQSDDGTIVGWLDRHRLPLSDGTAR